MMSNSVWLTLYSESSVTWCTQVTDDVFEDHQSGDFASFMENYDGLTPLTILLALPGVYIRQVEAEHLTLQQIKKAMPYLIEDDVLGDIEDVYTQIVTTSPLQVLVMPKETWQWWEGQMVSLCMKGCYLLSQVLPDSHPCLLTPNSGYIQSLELSFACPLGMINYLKSFNLELSNVHAGILGTPEVNLPEDINVTEVSSLESWVKPQMEQAPSLWSSLGEDVLPMKKVYKHVAVFFMVALFSLTALKILEVGMLKSTHKQIDEKIATIYYQIFPQATQVIAPRVRVEQLIGNQGNTSGDAFFELTHELGQALNKVAVEMTELQFQSQTLVAKLKAANYEQITQLLDNVSKNITVKEQDTRTQEDGLRTTLILTKGAS